MRLVAQARVVEKPVNYNEHGRIQKKVTDVTTVRERRGREKERGAVHSDIRLRQRFVLKEAKKKNEGRFLNKTESYFPFRRSRLAKSSKA